MGFSLHEVDCCKNQRQKAGGFFENVGLRWNYLFQM